jgi:hypothetical protein
MIYMGFGVLALCAWSATLSMAESVAAISSHRQPPAASHDGWHARIAESRRQASTALAELGLVGAVAIVILAIDRSAPTDLRLVSQTAYLPVTIQVVATVARLRPPTPLTRVAVSIMGALHSALLFGWIATLVFFLHGQF